MSIRTLSDAAWTGPAGDGLFAVLVYILVAILVPSKSKALIVAAGLALAIESPILADPGDAVIQIAPDRNVEMIVVGLRHRSMVGKLILGSIVQRILLDATCPVLAVRPHKLSASPDCRTHRPARVLPFPHSIATGSPTDGREDSAARRRRQGDHQITLPPPITTPEEPSARTALDQGQPR
nr:universal stress protein [Arthrobacter sp. ISL-5]